MDFVTVSTGLILPYWMGLPIRYIQLCCEYTVLGESYSAGRLYDKIEDETQGKIKFILDKGVVCELVE